MLASVVSLTSVGLAVPAASSTTTTAAPAASTVTTSTPALPVGRSPQETSALTSAATAGSPVEVSAEDSEHTTTYANPDGSLTTQSYPVPIRVARGSSWATIDPTLTANGAAVAPAATKAPLSFSAGGTGSLASFGTPGGPLTMDWPGTLPAPGLSGATATYRSVLPGADLVLTARRTGFEYSLVLRSAPSAAVLAALSKLRIPLHLPAGQSLTARTGGGWQLADTTGAVLANISTPVMFDAAHDPSKLGVDREHPVATQLTSTPAGPELDLSVDTAFLTAPSTQYPVTVDPSVSLPDNLDTFVTTYCTTCNYDTNNDLFVGPSQYGTLYRSFLRFDDSKIKGMDVTSAKLAIWEHDPYTCSPKPTWTEGAAGMGAGTTWNTQPAMDNIQWNSSSFNGSGNSNPPSCGTGGGQNLDITGLAQSWSHNGYASPETLALRAPNESDISQWKIFYSGNTFLAPFISTTYNVPPTAPTNLTPPAGTTGTTPTPTLTATAHQPSGNTARLDFQVLPYAGGTAVASGSASNVANGGTGSYTVPANALRGGQHYQWQVRAYDGVGYGPWSPSSDFTVTPTVPSAPTDLRADPCSTCGGPAVILSREPALSAAATNPDGGVGTADFEVWSDSATPALLTAGSGSAASGQQASWQAPAGLLLDDGAYKAHVRARNGTALSPWSAWLTFTVNRHAEARSMSDDANRTAQWQVDNGIGSLNAQLKSRFGARWGGAWQTQNLQGADVLNVHVKNYTTTDDAQLSADLGSRYNLLAVTTSKYSLDEIKAAQKTMHSTANGRPDGNLLSATSQDVVNNSVHAYMRQGGAALLIALQAAVGADMITSEEADVQLVQQADDSNRGDGSAPWQAGKVATSNDPNRTGRCTAGFVWTNPISNPEYYGSTAGHCIADYPYDVALGTSSQQQRYGAAYNSPYWQEINHDGSYKDDITVVRGDPATNYTAPLLFVNNSLTRSVDSWDSSREGEEVCRSGITTHDVCTKVGEIGVQSTNRNTGVTSYGLTCTSGAPSDYGDSGAPYYAAPKEGNTKTATAVGVHSAGRNKQGTDNGGCYSEVESIQNATGYRVLTH